MARHIDAWMDGVSLSSVGNVNINEVHEESPSMELVTDERPGRYGQRLSSRKRQTLKVTLDFVIMERFNLAARAETVAQIAKWAHGTYLELSNHPDQRLRVVCTSVPTVSEARNYAAVLKVEFTAYSVPYWENILPAGVALTGTENSGSLFNPGTADTPVNITVVPSEDTLTSFSVTVDGQTITLSGLTVTAGKTLSFNRDVRDDLLITYNGASQLSKRTAASADDLIVSSGTVDVSYTADAACTVTISCRGRWL